MKDLFRICGVTVFVIQVALAQTATHKTSKTAAAKPPVSAWTPEVQQYLGVQQGSFTMVGLNRLSKAQLDALVNAAKSNLSGDPRKHLLTCGPSAPAQAGRVPVLVTGSGGAPQGPSATGSCPGGGGGGGAGAVGGSG